MRILYVTHGYYCGSGKVLRTLISGMIARGHDVAVISEQPPDQQWWDCVPDCLQVFDYQRLRRLGGVTRTALREFQPDVIHGHQLREAAAAALVWRTTRCQAALLYREAGQAEDRGRMGRTMFRIVADLATRVASPSRPAIESWYRFAPSLRQKGVVICNAVEVPVDTAPRASTRASLGVPADAVLLLNAASISGRKNQKSIVAAMGALTDECKRRVFLAVAGGVHEEQERSEIAATALRAGLSDQVLLLGLRSDIADLYAASDIAVLSSTSESFGLAVIEGMAAGKPVVSTACGGPNEIVVDGQTGFLVPVGDPAAMAQAIANLIEDPDLARRMGEAGRRRVEERYSLSAFCDAYEQLYREMIESATR